MLSKITFAAIAVTATARLDGHKIRNELADHEDQLTAVAGRLEGIAHGIEEKVQQNPKFQEVKENHPEIAKKASQRASEIAHKAAGAAGKIRDHIEQEQTGLAQTQGVVGSVKKAAGNLADKAEDVKDKITGLTADARDAIQGLYDGADKYHEMIDNFGGVDAIISGLEKITPEAIKQDAKEAGFDLDELKDELQDHGITANEIKGKVQDEINKAKTALNNLKSAKEGRTDLSPQKFVQTYHDLCDSTIISVGMWKYDDGKGPTVTEKMIDGLDKRFSGASEKLFSFIGIDEQECEENDCLNPCFLGTGPCIQCAVGVFQDKALNDSCSQCHF